MTVAQRKNQLAQKLLQTEDKHILKAIELIFDQEDSHSALPLSQKNEIDKRLAEIESGNAKFYTLQEVKKMARLSRLKK